MGFGPNMIWSYFLDDAMGWLLFFVAFGIPLLSESIRKNQSILLACWFAIFLHQAVTVTNCYLFLLPGGDDDAGVFHKAAAESGGSYGIASLPYVKALRIVVSSFGSVYDLWGLSYRCAAVLSR